MKNLTIDFIILAFDNLAFEKEWNHDTMRTYLSQFSHDTLYLLDRTVQKPKAARLLLARLRAKLNRDQRKLDKQNDKHLCNSQRSD